MTYRVFLHSKANKNLRDLEKQTKERIKDKLEKLKTNCKKGKKLKGSKYWRLRIGDYKAIYEVKNEDKEVIVLFIGHRNNVYDDFSKLI
ncbi:MAG: Cytotoxic translational repressor of toxin-antitoxin stability system, RelE family [Candidatus Methanohalarchaeum thermophilum]|uniref:Cytotoxic translational repressor of toxin-antitoxin stability system, RelE family n=1 Tax=Methanohalarchaeum thermophilum TaxID=1903181 RepID=A0A1Q6DXQ1_METT1|nr:MAG: Cytotoxic translational repressor of toxin-antitoxin stability system, RelE family [Candidatus Methanohalarchaeum thermophilum]